MYQQVLGILNSRGNMSVLMKLRNWWSSLLSWWTPQEIIEEYKEGKKKAKEYTCISDELKHNTKEKK